MLRNYLVIALRFMVRQKGFSFINIAGLTLGIASALLIILYLDDELSYDTFHPGAERVYRITQGGKIQGKEINSAYTGFPLASTLQKEGIVEATTRLANWATFPMRFEDRAFTEPNLLLADSNFFSFFNFPLLEGNVHDVLQGERKIVITESAAKRYFNYQGPGDKTPLGKTMVLAQGYLATISGIAQDPPRNAHFHFTFVLSMASWDEAIQSNWIARKVITYVRLKEEKPAEALAHVLTDYTRRYIGPELLALRNQDIEQYRTQGNDLHFGIQSLLDIHLTSSLDDEIEQNNDVEYIYLFTAVAAFIILLACINFMNLSTARSASRAKEVGIRKSVGAPTSRLIIQFLLESYFYIIIAVVLALFLVMLAIGPFNIFTQKEIDSATLLSARFLIGLAIFIFAIGLIAGSYPSFYLTQFRPIETLKGIIYNRHSSYNVRNILVVFQFFISTSLIIATLTVYLQLRYVQQLELGFDKANIVSLLHTANLGSNGNAFKEALLQQPEVKSASYSNRLPPNIDWQYMFRQVNTEKDYLLNVYEVDYDHLKTMKYAMVKGRFFSPDFPGDSTAIILNETAAARMKMNLMLESKFLSDYGSSPTVEREVIGIIRDFNFQSPKDSIHPVALVLGREPNWEMAIRIRKGEEDKALFTIQQLWKKFAPYAPLEYNFLDKNIERKLETEKRIGLIFLLFTALAIFIACLGLFGLATFTAEKRIKEIGIRKVLGATVNNIVLMLNLDFLKLVLIANLLAAPVTGLLMYLWLTQFAYHITIPWWVFVVSCIITVIIAFLSVSSQAVRAARGNPVESLRNE